MKTIELLSDKRVADTINELIVGVNKLKEVKRYFNKIERKPDYLNDLEQKDFFDFIDSIDIKVFEAIEEVNRCIATVTHWDLDKNINN